MAELSDRNTTEAVIRRMGRRLRERRKALGRSLDDAAKHAGVTAEDLHAYEIGDVAIPAGVLARLAISLQIDVEWVFRETPEDERSAAGKPTPRNGDPPEGGDCIH